ncbi:GPI mannosyltransferase 3, putative [Plasmodium berghei]|uniref:Mannosyltransferase n=2 Tax=Plasmodium berghei TaxID=5821 RepID=A0A509ATD6_PLABA|nr:GPI mannosyltransferase 3, putative [Plasmodium berghei ANKA]CXJ02927.1 GPI mannosyltransferase 3, putative [Plasmodium berghei]SCL98381.1 GPI mannosyltransferase 3, putative [Plasmodium berghei]SCM16820.1 GPI mannosyltransferase 3, putative [Plasmodium berghei]SCM18618.1 GPI mannosyltransferase 3, putative [Plasmodium berghei]SCN28053.1 GPI mannosyltransferase 3, putative [Plasmodium berghei]|eukprot:XP_034423704.1 GPI mannosyltransferase 3, putative [Plasmodium berghei ANKA]
MPSSSLLKIRGNILRKIVLSKYSFFYLSIFRLFNSLFVQTSFFPDEYAQSVEISHYMIFGYGHMPWEWEPCISLRSIVHPLFYAILFYILKISRLDSPFLVLYVPKIFQGICAAFADYIFIKLIIHWYCILYYMKGKKKKEFYNFIGTILVCYFFCWFNFYSICRTSSNSFEYLFNIVGVYFLSKNYYPSIILQKEDENKIKNYVNNDIILNKNSKYEVDNLNEGQNKNPYKRHEIKIIQDNEQINETELIRNKSFYDFPKFLNFVNDDNNKTKEIIFKKNKNMCNEYQIDMNNNIFFSISDDFYNKKFHIKNFLLSLFFSSVCVLIRPTALLFWLIIYFFYIIKIVHTTIGMVEDKKNNWEKIKRRGNKLTWIEALIIGTIYTIIFLLISIAIDSYFYGQITICFYNFFMFNFISGENKYFGDNFFFFYFFSAIPSIYLTLTPFTYYKFFNVFKRIVKKKKFRFDISRIDNVVYIATFFEILILSFSNHKEHKILIGYIPFLSILTGISLYNIGLKIGIRDVFCGAENKKIEKIEKTKKGHIFTILINISFILHLISIFFFSVIHNRSPENVAKYFRNLKISNDNEVTIFITDCYDIPLYSHIHRKYKIGFLDCTPYIKNENGETMYNWRTKIYDDNFGRQFFDMFNNDHKKSNYIEPYIFTNKSFYWFGNTHFNEKNNFKFIYEKLNFSCLKYRFDNPLHGEPPLYIVTNSNNLKHLKKFLKKYNYYQDTQPFFSYFQINDKYKINAVYHFIFKRHINQLSYS